VAGTVVAGGVVATVAGVVISLVIVAVPDSVGVVITVPGVTAGGVVGVASATTMLRVSSPWMLHTARTAIVLPADAWTG
jgi:hypothetical protein